MEEETAMRTDMKCKTSFAPPLPHRPPPKKVLRSWKRGAWTTSNEWADLSDLIWILTEKGSPGGGRHIGTSRSHVAFRFGVWGSEGNALTWVRQCRRGQFWGKQWSLNLLFCSSVYQASSLFWALWFFLPPEFLLGNGLVLYLLFL